MSDRFAKSVIAAIAASLLSSGASAVSLRDISPAMRHPVKCMVELLKKEPSITGVKIGRMTGMTPGYAGPFPLDDRRWIHPYVEYTKAKGPYHQIVRFYSDGGTLGDQFSFMAMLPGLSVVGERPDDWGTHDVIRKWKAACGVNASVLYN